MSRPSGVGRRALPTGLTLRPIDGLEYRLELGADGHPFTHRYIGLGLLDEASVRRDGDAWTAEYPDQRGDPYLRVRIVADGHATLEETDEDGRRVATTVGRSMAEAIGRHGAYALGEVSPFWIRVLRHGAQAWIALTIPEIRYSFIPAIAIGGLYVPVPLDRPWVEPVPGPVALRIGLPPSGDPPGPRGATLLRFVAGEDEPREERIRLARYSLPGILVTETVGALYAANGPLRSIEWRPFVLPQPVDRVGQLWHTPRPTRLSDGALLNGFGILEDEPPRSAPRAVRAT